MIARDEGRGLTPPVALQRESATSDGEAHLIDRITARTPNRPADEGMTLVEVIVAVVILSLSVVATLGALTAVTATSNQSREAADVGAVARNGLEYVKSQTYVPCSSFSSATAPYLTPTSLTIHQNGIAPPSIVQITSLDGTKVFWPNTSPHCGGLSSDPGLQLVEIQDSSTDKSATTTQWVVISQNQANE